jgi:hypothetical protein
MHRPLEALPYTLNCPGRLTFEDRTASIPARRSSAWDEIFGEVPRKSYSPTIIRMHPREYTYRCSSITSFAGRFAPVASCDLDSLNNIQWLLPRLRHIPKDHPVLTLSRPERSEGTSDDIEEVEARRVPALLEPRHSPAVISSADSTGRLSVSSTSMCCPSRHRRSRSKQSGASIVLAPHFATKIGLYRCQRRAKRLHRAPQARRRGSFVLAEPWPRIPSSVHSCTAGVGASNLLLTELVCGPGCSDKACQMLRSEPARSAAAKTRCHCSFCLPSLKPTWDRGARADRIAQKVPSAVGEELQALPERSARSSSSVGTWSSPFLLSSPDPTFSYPTPCRRPSLLPRPLLPRRRTV